MTKQIVYASDFLLSDIVGGGELNDNELLKIFKEENYKVDGRRSHLLDKHFIEQNPNRFYIISNFINLPEDTKKALEHVNYIIYEHDHKYLITRNPAAYENYTAPTNELINIDFYKNAKAVVCQSSFHQSIIERNIPQANVVNLSGNLWSLEVLNFMQELATKDKRDCCSIMASNNWHKNTNDAVKFCVAKKINFNIIQPAPYKEFLTKLSDNDKFIFFPQTPETLSRVVVESRMCGMKVITNQNVGATYEPWFKLKGIDLINHMIEKRKEIFAQITGIIHE